MRICLWREVLIQKYELENLDYHIKGGGMVRGAQWWCDTLTSCEIFEKEHRWFQSGLGRGVRGGNNVSFWEAKWLGDVRLCNKFNMIFLNSEEKKQEH